MKIGSIMYQTSSSKGQELVAQRMTRAFGRLGDEAYLIAGPYHDGKRVISGHVLERSIEGYMRGDKNAEIPLLRVDGYVSGWPPRRIMFRNFVDALRNIVDRFGIEVLITHSTLWNGPEEAVKFIQWRRTMNELGLQERRMIYCHMSHYQPPEPIRYNIAERSFRMAWNRLVFPQILETADMLLVTTPVEKQYMVEFGARESRLHLFPGGVDEELFKDCEKVDFETFREKYGIPENKRIISYVGTIEERKNPLNVVRVAKNLVDQQEIHFVVAGHESNQTDQVTSEARKLNNISYVGEISDEEKIQLIKGSYLNILMSHMEALGLTQLEFMYGGVPIITSAVGGQRWLVRDKVDGIHLNGPEDLEGAVRAIRHLLKNEEARDEMAKNARRRAQVFTMAKLTRKLKKKFQAALSG